MATKKEIAEAQIRITERELDNAKKRIATLENALSKIMGECILEDKDHERIWEIARKALDEVEKDGNK